MRRSCLLAACLLAACGAPDVSVDGPDLDAGDAAAGRPALGATPHPGGTTFRVWAPGADRVFVTGEFNGWSTTSTELARAADGTFSADVPGAREGQKYRYLVHRGSDVLTRSDPRAGRMESSAGASVIHDPAAYSWTSAPFTPPPFDSQVIYELHVGAFNPLVPGRPGTWQSATSRLDHVAALGVNMIEVLPVAEFAGDFSWGYNPAWPFAPESAYGTPEDMKRFIDEAHRRGIGVILDVVHNHWGRGDLGMRCFDAPCAGDDGVYFYAGARGATPWGPRPNYGAPQVRQYIVDNALRWLGEYRMDGLRWDSVSNIRAIDGGTALPDGAALLRQAMTEARRRYPGAIQIAEDLKGLAAITAPVDGGGYGFSAQWDPRFYWPAARAVLAAKDADRDLAALRGALTAQDGGDATRRVIYSESHDSTANGRQRLPQMISPADPGSLAAQKLSTLAAALVLTAPGVPMLLQGQELLEDGAFSDHQPLDWSKAERRAGLVRMYRDLIRLRRNLDGHSAGLGGSGVRVFHENDAAKVLAYHRFRRGGPGDDVIVLVNLSGRPFSGYRIGLPAGGRWHVRFNGDSRGYSADFAGTTSDDVTAAAAGADGLPFSGAFGVGAYSVVVLSQ